MCRPPVFACRWEAIDFPELLQQLRVAMVQAHDFGELRAIAGLVLDDLAPDLDGAEQQRPAYGVAIAVVPLRADPVAIRVDPVRSHVATRRRIGLPDVVFHERTVQQVTPSPHPVRLNDPPGSVRQDLSDTHA